MAGERCAKLHHLGAHTERLSATFVPIYFNTILWIKTALKKSRTLILSLLISLIIGEVAFAIYVGGGVYAHSLSLSDYNRGNFKFARAYGLISAYLGDVNAAALVGTMYMRGNGGPVDGANAVYWLERAANHGNVISESLVGLMYATGQGGVTAYQAKAKIWLLRAANHGDAVSRSLLNSLSRAPGNT